MYRFLLLSCMLITSVQLKKHVEPSYKQPTRHANKVRVRLNIIEYFNTL